MNILFEIKPTESETYSKYPCICSVPDEWDNGTTEGLDKIETLVCDIATNCVRIFWKFENETDEKYRDCCFPDWSYVKELEKKITDLEAKCQDFSEHHQEPQFESKAQKD